VGVHLGISGAVRSEKAREELLRWVTARAVELDWTSRPVELAFKKGKLRAGPKTLGLEMPHARGVSLLPHFACEELPLIFVDASGTLVEEVVDEPTKDAPTFLGSVLVKTQFAGPAVHREICDLLAEIRDRFSAELVIDDETGYAATRDAAALLRAFEDGWNEIVAKVRADRPRPGMSFQVGEFPFEIPEKPVGGETASLKESARDAVVSADRAFAQGFGGFGTTLDHSRASVLDLELAISDADDPAFPKVAESPQTERLVLEAGAYFGRTLAALLGGAWRVDDGRLVLTDVGRCGLVVDPFQVARDRVLRGPPYSFVNHLEVYERLAAVLGREDSR
jgi:hypothetical protein